MKDFRKHFKLGSYLMIATAVLHLAGHITFETTASNEKERALIDLITNYEYNFGGIERSTMDFLNGYSLAFSVFLLFMGLINLIGIAGANLTMARNLVFANIVCTAALVMVSAVYFILPPILMLSLVLLLMLSSGILASKTQS